MDKPNEKMMMLSEAINAAKETFMLRTELFAMAAAETKAEFDAFVAAGFSTDQAMQFCCARIQRK